MQYSKNFDKAKKQIAQGIDDVLNNIGNFIVAEAQLRTPVDTGNLRRGLGYKTDKKENGVFMGSNIEYDEYVELGTSKQKAQPHWKPAVMDNLDDINKIVTDTLAKVGDD